ncbi:DHA2 family efflux MFS transporter permease subunit [Streptomyces sp. NRRL S-1868]|uniref:DHA2 family efflux MFS transporter permease subunit n=1 Tax=Streptomyces sp. NRRL S-1868 TaxID=1463892 RepID=UPI0006893D22|nr:DHA2 family efflux MFS transporter permease subunit [Streptomyces sp. NRRL S-1868]
MSTTTGTATAAEAPSPAPERLSWPPLIALSLGYFLVMLDVTVVTVAVPVIRGSVHAGASEMAWVVDGYSAVFGGLLLMGGGFGDRLGHRKVFLTGLGFFAVASVGCALATTPAALIASRLAQGAGGALLVPTSLALLTAAYPATAVRAKALGVWAGISGIAFAAGPLVGGLLVAGLNWRAAFWLNVPVALLGVWLTLRYVPAPAGRAGARGLDPLGQVLGIVAVLALAGMLNEAGAQGWTSPVVLGAGALGVLALALFVLAERRTETRGDAEKPPLLPMSLFRSPGFSSTAAVGILLNLGYYGMLYLSTLYLQNERGYDALGAGLALLPTVCMAVVAAPLSGRLTARYGPYVPMTAALLLGAAGFVGWLLAGPDTSYWLLLPALIATGLATPSTVPAATAAIVQAAPAQNAGVASAVFNVARQIGNSLGVALFASLTAGRQLVSGLHLSALIASAAFLAAALLALSSWRNAKARAAA